MGVARITEKGPFRFGFNWSAGVPSLQVFISTWFPGWTLGVPPPRNRTGRTLFPYNQIALLCLAQTDEIFKSLIVSESVVISDNRNGLSNKISTGFSLAQFGASCYW